MFSLSFVVECNGFQYGIDDFLKGHTTRTTYYCIFNTTSLLSKGLDALETYRCQTLHHGLGLGLAGLPQEMARPVLMHAVLDAFYNLSERTDVAPAQVLVCVKGTTKILFVTHLVNVPGLSCPFIVRNLEDVACPTPKHLEPTDPGPLLTQEKA